MFRNVAYFICDLQKQVLPHISRSNIIINNVRTIMQANQEYRRITNGEKRWSRELGTSAPIVLAEFLPEKLGKTDQNISKLIPKSDFSYWNKPSYSMYNEALDRQLRNQGIKSILLSGVQTEWCITQTALDFKKVGYDVDVLLDGVGSNNDFEHDEAIDRLKRRGIWVTTTHGWIVERLRTADHPLTSWYIKKLKEN